VWLSLLGSPTKSGFVFHTEANSRFFLSHLFPYLVLPFIGFHAIAVALNLQQSSKKNPTAQVKIL
jgi:hypothetical protein